MGNNNNKIIYPKQSNQWEVKTIKKNILVLLLILILLFTLGCRDNQQDQPEPANPGENENSNVEDPEEPEEPKDPEKSSENENTQDPPEQEEYSIEDFHPIESDKEYRYVGEGNEYASYNVLVDYFDKESKRVQTRTNNGGTEMTRVLEIGDTSLSIIYSKEEVYYRDNLLKTKPSKNDIEILLKEPIEVGTKWTLPDDRVRTITNISTEIDTPLGSYSAIEVTTEGSNSTTKDYYAPGIGLIKSIFNSEGNEVTSTLSEIRENTSFEKVIAFYYPDQDQKIYMEEKTLHFKTNDISRNNIQKILAEKPPKETLLPLISSNTKINSLYLGTDNIAYVDFSKEFIHDMNAGALYESLILQSVVNTIGGYYGVDRVYLTIDGKPYESGHILLKKGEVIQVERGT